MVKSKNFDYFDNNVRRCLENKKKKRNNYLLSPQVKTYIVTDMAVSCCNSKLH